MSSYHRLFYCTYCDRETTRNPCPKCELPTRETARQLPLIIPSSGPPQAPKGYKGKHIKPE